jgi:segregation and condensation protein B
MDKIDDTERRKGELEALLFASSRPLSTRVLARSLDLSEEHTLALLGNFAADLTQPGRGLQLREIAGTWRLETKPIHANLVATIRRGKGERPLTQQALETLAVVALRQPVTADEVAAIRGVDSAGTIDTLSKRKLIAKITPRTAEGTAARWRTTQGFLDLFGLEAMEDLYKDNRLARIFGPVYGYGSGANGTGSEDSRSNSAQNDTQSQQLSAGGA